MEWTTIGARNWVENEPIGEALRGVFHASANRLQLGLTSTAIANACRLGVMAQTQVSACRQPTASVAAFFSRRVWNGRSFGARAEQGLPTTGLDFQTP